MFKKICRMSSLYKGASPVAGPVVKGICTQSALCYIAFLLTLCLNG